jgi:hypothetical protein
MAREVVNLLRCGKKALTTEGDADPVVDIPFETMR